MSDFVKHASKSTWSRTSCQSNGSGIDTEVEVAAVGIEIDGYVIPWAEIDVAREIATHE